MLSRVLPVLVALWVPCSVAAEEKPFRFRAGRHGKGELKYVEGVPVLVLRGTPEEIGTQAWNLTGDQVLHLLHYPKRMLAENRAEAAWPLLVAVSRLLISRTTAAHRRELQAAVKAGGSDTERANALYVANTMLELRRMGGCSTLIVGKRRSKTGEVLFGRNFDFPTYGMLHKYGLVSVVQPKGKRAFIAVGFPGLVGVVSGMNDAGLSIATLDVYRTADGSPFFDSTGEPMAFTYRRILEECSTVAEAEKLLRASKRTTRMNLAVCDRNGGVVFELTPRNVVVRKPEDGVSICTNHFRTKGLAKSKECRRFTAIAQRSVKGRLDVKDVQAALHAAHQRHFTIQSMVFEPAARKLHVVMGKGPVTAKKMTVLDLEKLLRSEPPRRR